ncbi:MAG: methyl-accepting chemotaxis protein [Geminicoccaceae bacterium]
MTHENWDRWHSLQDQGAAKERAIGTLVQELGYGGMIHQFKNYVLRKDDERIHKIDIGIGGALSALRLYERQGVSQEEKSALNAVRDVIKSYGRNIGKASLMVEDGSDSRAIDKAIKISDGPALAGIESLKAKIQGKRQSPELVTHKELLNRIRTALGYGGLIHQFKNYVLRQDSGRIAKVQSAGASAGEAIHAYRALGANPGELQNLATIEQVIETYLRALGEAERLARNGSAPEAIDKAVKINDGPALAALDALDVAIADRMNSLETQIETNLSHIQLMAWLIVAAAVIGSLMPSYLIRRILNDFIARPVQELTKAMHTLASGDTEVELPKVHGDNEIGAMAAATEVFQESLIRVDRLQKEGEEKAKLDRARQQDLESYISELQSIVSECVAGDFSRRITWQSEESFVIALSDVINQLIDTIDRGLKDVAGMLAALAEGDLDRRITVDYQGAFGRVKDSANGTADQLSGIVTQILSATSAVDSASGEIASGTEDLSKRTEDAAASLQETAASTEEMASTVKQNAENSRNASRLASSADKSAKTGGDVVEQAVTAMAKIEESAQKITDIISVIDEIAFQTNLLALNASVEAARAGEAGKGFAVVAQEVRQLAQRSAQAAADIKNLIQDSNGQVQDGVQLVNQAGEALAEIVGSIGKVASIVQEISSASEEQAAGVQEINSSVANMDEMTQQNSALVEQSTASARALSEQSAKLSKHMAFFKLDNVDAPPVRSKPGRPKATTTQPAAALCAADEGGWSEF